jgi:DNA-binding IscR family transcriptional regulator
VSGYAECGCPEPATCGLRAVWKEARDALAAIMDNTTFADIRDRHLKLRAEGREVLDYAI